MARLASFAAAILLGHVPQHARRGRFLAVVIRPTRPRKDTCRRRVFDKTLRPAANSRDKAVVLIARRQPCPWKCSVVCRTPSSRTRQGKRSPCLGRRAERQPAPFRRSPLAAAHDEPTPPQTQATRLVAVPAASRKFIPRDPPIRTCSPLLALVVMRAARRAAVSDANVPRRLLRRQFFDMDLKNVYRTYD